MYRKNYTWDHLDKVQLFKYAEYFIKMELTRYGLEVYDPRTGNDEIDFSAKTSSSRHYDFQIRTVKNFNYISFPKSHFVPRENLIAAIVIFVENSEPYLFFIPSKKWETPDELLVSRDDDGKSELGLSLSYEKRKLLEPYSPEIIVNTFK